MSMLPAPNSYEYTSYLFEAERDFSPVAILEWMRRNWWHSIMYSMVYVAVVFGGQWAMKDRRPFGLKGPLIAWNLLLAVFSFFGMVRTAPSFFYALSYGGGVAHSMCKTDFLWGVSGFWTVAFVLSKPFELVDTVFLVFRKRPVIFLHWYHHATVMICGFMAFKDLSAVARWYMMMNYTVHTIMYGYYGLRAVGVWFPKWVPMGITTMQIAQMVVGFAVTSFAFWMKQQGATCDLENGSLIFSLGIYASYFYLFAALFYKAYFVTKKYDKKDAKAAKPIPRIQENGVDISAPNGRVASGDLVMGYTEKEGTKDTGSTGLAYGRKSTHTLRLRKEA